MSIFNKDHIVVILDRAHAIGFYAHFCLHAHDNKIPNTSIAENLEKIRVLKSTGLVFLNDNLPICGGKFWMYLPSLCSRFVRISRSSIILDVDDQYAYSSSICD